MEPCSDRRYVKEKSFVDLDQPDSFPKVELSERNYRGEKMGSVLRHMWRNEGEYFNNTSVFQYPYAEWIPNSIFYADHCNRMRSFDTWPKQMRPCPKDLVKSGF